MQRQIDCVRKLPENNLEVRARNSITYIHIHLYILISSYKQISVVILETLVHVNVYLNIIEEIYFVYLRKSIYQ